MKYHTLVCIVPLDQIFLSLLQNSKFATITEILQYEIHYHVRVDETYYQKCLEKEKFTCPVTGFPGCYRENVNDFANEAKILDELIEYGNPEQTYTNVVKRRLSLESIIYKENQQG